MVKGVSRYFLPRAASEHSRQGRVACIAAFPLEVFSNRTCLLGNSLRGSLVLIDFGDFHLGRGKAGWQLPEVVFTN
jgi:hypothetical protein